MVFVIDISKSMQKPAGGTSRFELAKRELIGAINALPEDTYFTIVPFHKEVLVFNRRLLTANDRTKERAVEYVKSLKMAFGTASYDALERAFNIDGNTEAIFFLSDGAPYGGKIADKTEIVRAISRENFFRRIAIYSFGVGIAGGATKKFMADLAEKNGGVYIGVQ
jgi:hypothetical protein